MEGDWGKLGAFEVSPLMMSWIEASKASTLVDICITERKWLGQYTADRRSSMISEALRTAIQNLGRHLVELRIKLFKKRLNLGAKRSSAYG